MPPALTIALPLTTRPTVDKHFEAFSIDKVINTAFVSDLTQSRGTERDGLAATSRLSLWSHM